MYTNTNNHEPRFGHLVLNIFWYCESCRGLHDRTGMVLPNYDGLYRNLELARATSQLRAAVTRAFKTSK